jgi:hypothetical protein
MAKKADEGKVNKSQEIRNLFEEDAKMGSKEVIGRLKEKGITVSPAMVYLVRSQMRKKQRKATRERAVRSMGQAGTKNPVEIVQRVKQLAGEVGGMNQLKRLVDLLVE